MRVPIRIVLFAMVVALVMSFASVAVAAPTLGPGVGWSDGPHNSNPGLCTNCHKFQIWPAPVISATDPVAHGSRGATCTSCHTVLSAPPSDLLAPTTFGSATGFSAVTLGWTPVTGAVSYLVYRSASSAGPFNQVASVAGPMYNDAGRTAGMRYYYQVRGVDSVGGIGAASATVGVTTFSSPTVRVDSSLSQLTATGWITRTGTKFYGGSTRSNSTAGKRITVPFRGTKVVWYGTRGRAFGKAAVYVDGKYQRTVDLYYGSTLYNRALFTKTGLSDGAHTLVIIVSSSKNTRATGRRVDVDSFAFTGIAPGLNQEESRATLVGAWSPLTGTSYSASSAKASQESTASLTYKFRGTGVTWVGSKSPTGGKATVYIDGVLKGTVDLWAGTTAHRRPVYSATGLAKTTHTLLIVPTGTQNAVATGNVVNADAFVTR